MFRLFAERQCEGDNFNLFRIQKATVTRVRNLQTQTRRDASLRRSLPPTTSARLASGLQDLLTRLIVSHKSLWLPPDKRLNMSSSAVLEGEPTINWRGLIITNEERDSADEVFESDPRLVN